MLTEALRNNKNQKSDIRTYGLLAIMFVCSALTGVVSQYMLSLVIVGCCGVLLFLDTLYLAFPFVMFYNLLYGTVMGVSVLRIFAVLLIFSWLFKLNMQAKPDIKYLAPLLVYLLYFAFVMTPQGVQQAILGYIDILCCALIVTDNLQQDEEKLKKFFAVYALVALVAFFTGLIGGNSMVQVNMDGDKEIELSRFMATFEDPNYMGYFYTLAVFSVFTLKLFHPIVRFAMIVGFYAVMLSSLSITAILINIVLWGIYLLVSGKIGIKSMAVIVVALLIGYSLYAYGHENSHALVIGDLVYRIDEKIEEFQSDDLSDATTSRTELSREHIEYFAGSSFSKKLVGGTPVNSFYIDPTLRSAAHNEYIDMLLNVGVLGTVVMMGFFLALVIRHLKEYLRTRQSGALFLFMGKMIWALYGLTLTFFLDFRFAFLFFI